VSGRPPQSRPSFGVARLAEETRERFVREILARVPVERLVELHLFAPIRQGGMESGVAVLAALPQVAPDVTPDVTPESAVPIEPAVEVSVDDAAVDGTVEDLDAPDRCDPTDDAAGPPPTEEPEPSADAAPIPDAVLDSVDVASLVADPAPSPDAPAPPARPARRHTVFTARYRLVVKGPERGKWDVEVREEADAPLITVDAVVRGVQLRSGEATEIERLDATGVARLLGDPERPAG
jgi:hypothetical protein